MNNIFLGALSKLPKDLRADKVNVIIQKLDQQEFKPEELIQLKEEAELI